MTTTQTPDHDPTAAPSTVEETIAELAVAATLLVCTASILAAGLGDPELLALVAVAAVVVLLVARAAFSSTATARPASP